jgi:hypothetical protein
MVSEEISERVDLGHYFPLKHSPPHQDPEPRTIGNSRKKDMATSAVKAKTQNTAPVEGPPEGFVKGGRPDFVGFFKPVVGGIVHGKITGLVTMQGENGPRDVVAIETVIPTKAYKKGDEEVSLEVGEVLGLGVTGALKELLTYVENRAEVYIVFKEKVPLGRGKSYWKVEQHYKGRKAKLQRTEDLVSEAGGPAADEDDIPF